MGGDKTDSQIVRTTWCNQSAPTGEGQRYECADGSVWDRHTTTLGTGDRIGYVVGDRIIER